MARGKCKSGNLNGCVGCAHLERRGNVKKSHLYCNNWAKALRGSYKIPADNFCYKKK
jgi:hypothetical protein